MYRFYLLVVCLAFLLLGVAAAQEKEKIVHGTIRAIDRDNGTITISAGTVKPQTKTLNLFKKDLPITHLAARPLTLADLGKDHRVALKVVGEDDVISIHSDADTDWGQIVTIARDHKEITARIGSTTRTLKLGPDVQIYVDGEPASARNLKANGYVNVCLSPDRSKILQIRQGKGITIGHPYGRNLHQTGFVLKKDDAARTLTVVSLGERYEKQDFVYDNWTYVRLTHSSYVIREGSMAELKGHCKIAYYYETDLRRLSTISADIPMIVRRPVAKFDATERRLTLALDDDQNSEAFPIAADAMIIRNGRPIGLDWVKEKRLVSAGLSLDQQEIIFLMCLDK
jgi:hypothetical protein